MAIIRKKKKKKEAPKEEPQVEKKKQEAKPKLKPPSVGGIGLPNADILDNIDINAVVEQRSERRRGDRRRGYRRIDDRNLISRAEEEAQILKEDAIKEGFSQGLRESRDRVQELKFAVEELLQAKEASFDMIKDDLIELSLKAAEKIVRKEVTVNTTVVLSIIADVIKELGKDEKQLTVKVNPDDEAGVNINLPNLFPSSKTEAKIVVEADDSVELGSCIVETKNGIIDARFSTQLNILQETLKEQL